MTGSGTWRPLWPCGAPGSRRRSSSRGRSCARWARAYSWARTSCGCWATWAGDGLNQEPHHAEQRYHAPPAAQEALGEEAFAAAWAAGGDLPLEQPEIANASGGDGSDVGAVELVRPELPELSVSGVIATEGNSGTTDAVFQVRLSEPPPIP